MNKNLVSIIMPAYNAEKSIGSSIQSVIDQTYQDWELLITNDQSTDNTVEIVEQYIEGDSRIKLFNQEVNGGVAAARNKSLENASGRYIAFLDSDDLWKPQKLELQLNSLAKNNGFFSCASYDVIDNNGVELNKRMYVPEIVNYKTQLKGSDIGCLTVVIDREKIALEQFKQMGHEDYVYWQNLLKKYGPATTIQEPLAFYRVDSNSLSSNKIEAMKWQYSIYRNEFNLNLPVSLYYLLNYSFNGVRKYSKIKS